MFSKGQSMDIPSQWVDTTLAGLERVNPYISHLEDLNVYDDEDDIALHLEYSDAGPDSEVAAIISLAPAALPTRRKLVIKRKGTVQPIFLDLFSPFVEPLHYLLLFPYGTLGWSPSRLNAAGKKFSQARWYRTRFFMNAEQMSAFSRLTGNCKDRYLSDILLTTLRRISGGRLERNRGSATHVHTS
jgi:hypothetical protein